MSPSVGPGQTNPLEADVLSTFSGIIDVPGHS